jgi:hypothetical protein
MTCGVVGRQAKGRQALRPMQVGGPVIDLHGLIGRLGARTQDWKHDRCHSYSLLQP